MSIGSQSCTDGWDIRRDENGKGQDSGSDAKSWDASYSKEAEASALGLGKEVRADTQDDERKDQRGAWRSPEHCELVSRRAGMYRAPKTM